jgi:hypothetical protein
MDLVIGLLSVLVSASPTPLVTQRTVGNIYLVQGSFDVEASPEVAWAVLTDYGALASFVSDLRRSSIRDRLGSGEVLVDQEATGRAAFVVVAVRLLLEMTETFGREIVFRDVLRQDFELFEGAWSLAPTSTGVKVSYRCRSKPRSGAPGFVVAPAVEASARQLLAQMQIEIQRRAHLTASTN